ncbi:NADAR family protein [Longispora sp. K20-0274]|uniref:NADAR family protein n=1 Tax=Longispora sp. K20-0274 TaxID=3088255 RepID=UPI0039995D31
MPLPPVDTPVQPRTVADLSREIAAGHTFEYLFFWGHRPGPGGTVGPGCLSQWWPAVFTVDGASFGTAEHYMMWAKALLFGDTDTAGRILAAPTPADAKALGRTAHGFDQDVWNAHRYDIVVAGSLAKFGQHPDLREFLLGTGDRILVEASPRDRIWGIGMGANNPKAGHPDTWRGQNLLGFALTDTRTALRQAHSPAVA